MSLRLQLTFDQEITPSAPIIRCSNWPGSSQSGNLQVAPVDKINSILVGIVSDSVSTAPNNLAGCGWRNMRSFLSRQVSNPVVQNSKKPLDGTAILGTTEVNNNANLCAGDVDSPNSTKIGNIFQPNSIFKYYGISGFAYYSIFAQLPGFTLTCVETNCEPGRIDYTLGNIYNPRDTVTQSVFERFTPQGFPPFEEKYVLVNDFELKQGQFVTSLNTLYGTIGGLGSITDIKGNSLRISGLTDTNARNVVGDTFFKIIYEQKCTNWTIKYYTVDSQGNPIFHQSRTQDVTLRETNRISENEIPLYSDYFDGTGDNKTYRYYKIIDQKNAAVVIGDLYGVIDISKLFLTNLPAIQKVEEKNVWFNISNSRWKDANTDLRLLKTGLNSNTGVTFVEKNTYFPDSQVFWSSIPNKEVLKINHNMDINFNRVTDLDPNANDNSFVVVGYLPQTTEKCLMLFTSRCSNLVTCNQTSDCLGLGKYICVSGNCVECSSNADCATNQSCSNNTCINNIPCLTDSNCATDSRLPVCNTSLGRCVNCNSSLDCKNGQYCKITDGFVCDTKPVDCKVDGDCKDGEICENNKCIIGSTPTTSTTAGNTLLLVGVVIVVLIIIFWMLRKKK